MKTKNKKFSFLVPTALGAVLLASFIVALGMESNLETTNKTIVGELKKAEQINLETNKSTLLLFKQLEYGLEENTKLDEELASTEGFIQ